MGTAGVSSAAASGSSAKAESASTSKALAPAYPMVWLNTVIDQWSHWTPDANESSHAGWLYKGNRYFYCWTWGAQYYAPETNRTSSVWLRTNDSNGNSNIYVTDTYLDAYGYGNDQNLLPYC
ncbi:hypothetical protein ADK54_06945 [Streptomyces sp. WM6378]|nr:hypothetical protein ADK54_06945 [Streptomyces sp. WM6378]